MELCNHFNSTDNVRIELPQLSSRNPIFAMIRASHDMNFKIAQKLCSHAKPQNKARKS